MERTRVGKVSRKTKETEISAWVGLDGPAAAEISTGIGFFDHMLTAFAIHGGLDLQIKCQGDLEVDCHHSIEDTGIVLGQALGQALGDKSGILRYGESRIPMDEALGECILDISGRPFLVFQAEFTADQVGGMDTQMVEEFFRAVAFQAGLTLHLSVPYGRNDHHKVEALFKAFAHAFRKAVVRSEAGQALSTKGVL